MHRRLEKNNRESYFRSVGVNPNQVVTADLIHGARVQDVSEEAAGTMISETDGLVTNKKNLFLSATAADCFLLYFYDPIRKVIGLAHAGWRGVVKNIVGSAVQKFVDEFGSNPTDILLCIGPGIQKCHFTAKADVVDLFRVLPTSRNYDKFVTGDGDLYKIDLAGIIEEQARESGISKIESCGECTYCLLDKYFSYRRDKPKVLETMLAYIGRS